MSEPTPLQWFSKLLDAVEEAHRVHGAAADAAREAQEAEQRARGDLAVAQRKVRRFLGVES